MAQSEQDIQDWDSIAETYTQFVGVPDDRIYQQFAPVLWETLGDIKNKAVLDLGCGHGWLAHLMQQAGAQVTGVDGSQALLDIAHKNYPDIKFMQHDLAQGLPFTERRFDRVVAHMVLMDIPELDLLLKSVKNVLKPDGTFVFTMPHPCFFNYKSYFDDDKGGWFRAITGYLRPEVWRMDGFGGHNHYHRSLTYYFEHLREHGFVITRLYEPQHIPGSTNDNPDRITFLKDVPVFILISCCLTL